MNKLNKIKSLFLSLLLIGSSVLGVTAFNFVSVNAATSCCYTGDCVTCGANECTHITSCVPWVKSCVSGSCPGTPPATPPPAVPPGSPPGTPAPPPAPPGCSSTTPGAAPVQVSPADGAIGLPNAIQFTWNPIASNKWGVGCPQTNGYYIYYAQTVDGGGVGTCAALAYSYAYRALVTSAALNLNWGKTYCWKVGAYNGTKSNVGGYRTLTVDAAPNIISSGFTNFDVCGKGKSGAAGQAGVTNPVTYSLTFSDPDSNDTYKEIWLAFLIQTYTAANYTEAQVQPAAHASKTVAMKIDLATGRAYTINNAGVWDAGALSGNLSNLDGSATLMNIGTDTTRSIAGNKATATFTIRFDANFPTNVLTIHGAALMQAANGTLFTSGGTGAAPRRYTKIPGTWQVDVIKPAATLTGPVYQANGTFNVTWGATDALGPLSVFSYIYSDVAGSQIKNVTNNITTTTPGAAIGYPGDAPNAGITAANLGAKNYSDLSPGNFANYSFAIYASDSACNISSKTIGANSPSPWMIGTNGDISGVGGIDNEEVPTINSFIFAPYIPVATPAFFSNYGAISGSSTNATGVISKLNQILSNYKDDAINSPNVASGLWYDFLLDKVKKNGKTPVSTLSPVAPATSRTILTTMSAGLGAIANARVTVEVTGDLIIGAATASVATCNVKAVIFVQGNLIINPDFTITAAPPTTPVSGQLFNGCMFIVRGNVTINPGTARTPALATNSATKASYDIINAYIVTDGTFNVPLDSAQGVAKKWDGLVINGGVVARNTINGGVTTIKRDIDKEANNIQPALLINFDPRYKITFTEDFASRDYSVREFGL